MSYEQKYLKYKKKYLALKKMQGGFNYITLTQAIDEWSYISKGFYNNIIAKGPIDSDKFNLYDFDIFSLKENFGRLFLQLNPLEQNNRNDRSDFYDQALQTLANQYYDISRTMTDQVIINNFSDVITEVYQNIHNFVNILFNGGDEELDTINKCYECILSTVEQIYEANKMHPAAFFGDFKNALNNLEDVITKWENYIKSGNRSFIEFTLNSEKKRFGDNMIPQMAPDDNG
jgi:hypothetical protein